ncbi:unnamed protein product, partial [Prunus brigantina]
MTGPLSSSYPSQVPSPAVEISPENRREKLGFARNLAGFVLRHPAAIFSDQGRRQIICNCMKLYCACCRLGDKNVFYACGNFGECSIYRGDSAEISAESLVPLLLFEKGGYSLVSGPDIGVMSGFPQDSSRVSGNWGQVLS